MKGYNGRFLTPLVVLLVFLHGVSAQTLREDEENFFAFLKSALPNLSSVFNTTIPTCDWYPRVYCIGLGAQRRIFRLYLGESGLNGSIPNNTLGALSELSVLDLSNNFLRGEIPPDIFKLSNLVHLGLANNRLTGNVSNGVSNLYQLSKLDLSGNRLSGALPGSLGALQGLKFLDLHGNNFSGPLPKLVNTAYIRYLDLSSNWITGGIQSETLRNQELVYLNLSRNLLSGVIPKGINSLWRLRFLDLSGNDFEGAIPDLSNLGQLRMFDVSSNRLNGSIPTNVTRLPYLRTLSVAHNKLTGSLPSLPWGLSSAKIIKVDCSDNFLTGSIPEGLLASENLTIFRLASNKFSGRIPSNISEQLQELDLRSNRFTGEIPEALARLQSLKYLDLSANLLNGSIPWGLTEITSLQHLSLTGNGFEEGVLPDFSQMGSLEHLNLSYSNIVGVIPASFGELKSLAQLDLSHNRLNGSIPTNLSWATNLTSLDLSYNNLTGTIPPELISLTYLSRLNLSFNNLSGEVPSANQWGTLNPSSFEGNPLLCGVVVDRVCPYVAPPAPSPSLPLFPSPDLSPSTEPRGSSSKTLKVGAIVGIAVGAAVAFCLCASLSTLVLFHKHKFKRIPTHDPSHLAGSVTFESDPSAWAAQVPLAASIPVIMFEKPLLNLTFADLLQATNRFHKDSIILDGGYGPTFKGVLPGGLQIVVKVLYEGGPGNELEKAAQLEALGKIRHENLVSLVGYCIVRGERLLVYEFMENGNVYQRLHDPSEEAHHPDHWTVETWVDAPEKFSVTEELSWPIRHRIAVGVARALAFLHHGCSPNIVHRDVTSSNILLDSQYEPHLAECGLANLVESPRHDTPVMGGTVGYVPPEYGQTWKPTPRGDVYSFGVVLLELITGKRPTGHFFHDSYGGNLVGWVRSMIKEKRGYKCLDPKLLATGVESEMLETLRIGYLCTAELPTKRPTMQQVVGLLKDIHVEVTYM
ncbi:uncharacterized protein [Physcomitrium patens]|uniref:Protein kinase domain-containing protein n=1 Tax=Physcomitrium patens TaxID=3218 RepID=A0A2K1KQ29_PHYPA|nr:probable LRR receptor-like serine/threonine-protein kinase At2g24230 [Physcomitrium patens]XP_024374248.1 probable LRR receptor-like serine/threonine-protein kinase At2g24230 [Physcomitrium patens]XP_024374249.1 probable LRR receptor-like serine/threonine-protein kinase At2g24230 [Physcomitrium patens]XP_024374250.1 probable LRR receptor-like serine/threonine-protein kinase At2g24230 [Physcomitrium patens]XP_024374251.1 probable LRR receptor-like serine/threonine-protein kinase At2g24230 [Ph|eukprot:XP_024374247.1 probable LRR receptor-like serine/threonine-protein kinase At2g24230 [Physcomitrella patens]